METRVLTLFDDEEFFKPEPVKEKPKKEKASKIAAKPDEDIIPDTPLTESILPELQTELDSEAEVIITPAVTDAVLELNAAEGWPEADLPLTEIALAEQTSASETEEHAVKATAIETTAPEAIVESNPETDIIESQLPEPITETAFNEYVSDITPEETLFFEPAETPEEIIEINNEDIVDFEYPDTTEAIQQEEEIANPIEDATEPEEAIFYQQEESPSDNLEEPQPEEEDTVAAPQEITIEAKEQDKTLNQQILSELIQLDYTALLQKDYNIDTERATISSKEKTPVAANTVIEDSEEEETADDEHFVFEEVAPLPEWKLDKKYYSIGEVSQLFEVNTSHIRFWTNEFKLKPRTNRKGDRLYSPKDIAELRLIHHLVKVKKHTIKGAREKLKSEKTGVNNKLDLKESLMELKDSLMRIREQL